MTNARATEAEVVNGIVENGFDYQLQVWVAGGIVQPCGHPDEPGCCNAGRWAGCAIQGVPGHEVRA